MDNHVTDVRTSLWVGEKDGALDIFGLEFSFTGKVNIKEGTDVEAAKDLLALGTHTHNTLKSSAWVCGLMNTSLYVKFTGKAKMHTQHRHTMAAESYGQEKMGRKKKWGHSQKEGTLGPVMFRLMAKQTVHLQETIPVFLAMHLLIY